MITIKYQPNHANYLMTLIEFSDKEVKEVNSSLQRTGQLDFDSNDNLDFMTCPRILNDDIMFVIEPRN
jgi:hypothetical protein